MQQKVATLAIDTPQAPLSRFHVAVIAPNDHLHSAAFQELAEATASGLQTLGHEVTAGVNEFAANARNILFGAHLLTPETLERLPSASIVYNTEQVSPDAPLLSPGFVAAVRRFETWDYSLHNIAAWKAMGIPQRVRHAPPGYAPQLTRIERATDQDIDVLFYGSLNPRRMRVIDALRQRGVKVELVFGCYGKLRDQLIARSKLVLNLHFYDQHIFESVRVFYLLANSKAVVAEIADNTEIDPRLRRAVHGTSYDGLVDACLDLLADDARRRQREELGYEIMRTMRATDFLRPLVGDATMTIPPAAPQG